MENNNKNKGGRPLLPEYKKKNHAVKVMFSPVDYIYVKASADECGLRVAQYVHCAAMNQETTTRLTKDEMDAIRKIGNVGNNLNQITKAMHLGVPVEQEIKNIVAFITEIIRKVR
ncbi:plasmid mobilization relaxosome protein MobC [uncultured Bacteroides sp.]|uniref:plasmid mobilization protein n=1 Tax=uncultured Bacteroides sp. TaxID=162156 RepID=UPI00266EF9D7|nr:plasmid mobilization relaxosome protein MobC [uncultured Bacteroides sp.]